MSLSESGSSSNNGFPGRKNEKEKEDDYFNSESNLNILATNACSLVPKIDCCMEYFKELETSLAFLTETWLYDSEELSKDIQDLEIETGYSMIFKNWPPTVSYTHLTLPTIYSV